MSRCTAPCCAPQTLDGRVLPEGLKETQQALDNYPFLPGLDVPNVGLLSTVAFNSLLPGPVIILFFLIVCFQPHSI